MNTPFFFGLHYRCTWLQVLCTNCCETGTIKSEKKSQEQKVNAEALKSETKNFEFSEENVRDLEQIIITLEDLINEQEKVHVEDLRGRVKRSATSASGCIIIFKY